MGNRRACGVAVLVLWAAGCTAHREVAAIAAAIGERVEAEAPAGMPAGVWNDTRAFYTSRAHAPVWVEHNEPGARADRALAAIDGVRTHGLDPGRYGQAGLLEQHARFEARDDADPAALHRALADLDVQITAAVLFAGSDVALGRTPPKRGARPWKSRRAAPDLAASLSQAVDAGDDLPGWFQRIAPLHPEYEALRRALADLHARQEQGGWAPVPAAKFVPGEAHAAVPALRARLVASGDLDAAAATADRYDEPLQEAIRRFQRRHGLADDGVAGRATLAAMNVPVEQRLRQLVVNLDRWRTLPDDLGVRHLLVNIAAYQLFVRDDGQTIDEIRVVVGARGSQTPLFSDEMETVVFSPYWNIPDTIVEGETAPAILRDPAYVKRNRIEILRRVDGRLVPVSPDEVDWENPEELRRLAIRQRPGPGNALGHVKFLFPNQYAVYLHDTPADELFARPGRAFSHGCVRVEEPEALAQYVLRDLPEWTPERIRTAMHAGVEKHVRLPASIPVHLVYFTTWADESDGLRLFADVYGHDRAHASALGLR